MKAADRKLLYADLCGRVPYGVKVKVMYRGKTVVTDYGLELDGVELEYVDAYQQVSVQDYRTDLYPLQNVKPYLRPMSSMTEREEAYFVSLNLSEKKVKLPNRTYMSWLNNHVMMDWLNENHFDYRGLIELGLALPAPEGMYKKLNWK